MRSHGDLTPGSVEAGPIDDRFSLGELLGIFVSRWKLVLVCVLGGAALAIGVSQLVTPTYRGSVVIAPSVRDSGAGGLASIMSQIGTLSNFAGDLGLGANATRKDVWIATLRSRELARLLIEKNQMVPELFHGRWDPSTKTWKPGFLGRTVAPSSDDAVQVLTERVLSIVEDKRTGLVTVSVDWRDPDLAAQWANDLVALANAEIRAGLIDENQRSVAYLENELSKTAVIERQEIIHRLIESRINESMLINARADYAFTVIDPATPPDQDRYVIPNRLRYALTGILAGLLIATMLVLASIGRKARI